MLHVREKADPVDDLGLCLNVDNILGNLINDLFGEMVPEGLFDVLSFFVDIDVVPHDRCKKGQGSLQKKRDNGWEPGIGGLKLMRCKTR